MNKEIITARKTIFSFSKCSEKMVFPKILHWDMIFLVLSGKMIFLFPENIILFFRRKMKNDLSQKSTWKYDILFKCSEKMVFPKKSLWNIIFLVVSVKMIFLFPENVILLFTWKYNTFFKYPKKMVFPKKKNCTGIHCTDLFCIIWKDGVFFRKMWYFFYGQKMKDDLSQEMHGNVTFSVFMYKCYKYDITHLPKKLKMIFSQENYI